MLHALLSNFARLLANASKANMVSRLGAKVYTRGLDLFCFRWVAARSDMLAVLDVQPVLV